MKKLLSILLCAALVLGLAACGTAAEEPSAAPASDAPASEAPAELEKLVVGASSTPHAEILEAVKGELEALGYELEVKIFDDYIMPNLALADSELDANYFQHEPYLLNFNAENGTDLVSAGAIHYEPLGVYAGKSNDLANVPDGAVIGIPADATNGGRALLLLQECGVLTLKDGISIDTFSDAEANAEAINFTEYDGIAENPHNVKIEALVADMLPAALPDLDFAVINGNYALPAGISDQLLANEDAEGEAASVFANIIAVRAGDETREDIQTLVNVLKSDEMKEWIASNYEGSVLPAA